MSDATRTCTHPGCDLPYNAKGYCNSHYSRWRRGKPMDAPIRRVVTDDKPAVKCEVWDCDREAKVKGRCRIHYQATRKDAYRNPNPCSINGCDRPRDSRGMCNPHASRFRAGKPMDAPIAVRKRRRETERRQLCNVLLCLEVPGQGGTCETHRGDFSVDRYHRKIATNGYVMVNVGKDHSSAHADGYLTEHRFVMELKLGRPLTASENIHHVNGQRHLNNESNLELWHVRQPPGQRVSDLLDWADEIHARYGHLRKSVGAE